MKFWFERGAWVCRRARQKLAQFSPEQVKSIAIIRHAALGDLILTRAFIHEARKFFPAAKITLSVVSNYTYGTPEDMVDRVHTSIGSDQRNMSKLAQLQQTRSLGYHDIIFDLAVSTRSIQTCLLNRARLKIGFPYRQWQRIFYDATIYRPDFEFEAEVMLDMLRLLGAKPVSPPSFQIPGLPQQTERPYVVYFTSASTQSKCWKQEYFAALISQLASNFPEHDHIILEGMAEWESVTALSEQLSEQDNIKCNKAMDLDKTLIFLKGASVVISNDTGVRNLAITCEVPTVGIFFSTIPYRYWPRYGLHDAVFNADGSMPSVQAVYESVTRILTKI